MLSKHNASSRRGRMDARQARNRSRGRPSIQAIVTLCSGISRLGVADSFGLSAASPGRDDGRLVAGQVRCSLTAITPLHGKAQGGHEASRVKRAAPSHIPAAFCTMMAFWEHQLMLPTLLSLKRACSLHPAAKKLRDLRAVGSPGTKCPRTRTRSHLAHCCTCGRHARLGEALDSWGVQVSCCWHRASQRSSGDALELAVPHAFLLPCATCPERTARICHDWPPYLIRGSWP